MANYITLACTECSSRNYRTSRMRSSGALGVEKIL